jgi:hypothetical protein
MLMFMEKLRGMYRDDPLAFEVCVRHVASVIEDQRGEEGKTDPRGDWAPWHAGDGWQGAIAGEEAGMNAKDVWVANDKGSEIVRARDIAATTLDYDGNVTVRLAGGDGVVVTVARHRAHRDEHRPDDFHRQLVRVIAELSDTSGAFLVRAVYDETRGWHWASEQL